MDDRDLKNKKEKEKSYSCQWSTPDCDTNTLTAESSGQWEAGKYMVSDMA